MEKGLWDKKRNIWKCDQNIIYWLYMWADEKVCCSKYTQTPLPEHLQYMMFNSCDRHNCVNCFSQNDKDAEEDDVKRMTVHLLGQRLMIGNWLHCNCTISFNCTLLIVRQVLVALGLIKSYLHLMLYLKLSSYMTYISSYLWNDPYTCPNLSTSFDFS